ncbi:MAG: hypothetical protein OXG78_17460 [Chloroflexi bacterium]|nr:hypothetical protein [Chloroflexota bacterium]
MTDEKVDAGRQPSRLTLYGLAMVGGVGMTLMILGASVGVIYGAALDAQATHSLGLTIVMGLLLLVLAIGFWLGWVRPFERFDDINVPGEPEHH